MRINRIVRWAIFLQGLAVGAFATLNEVDYAWLKGSWVGDGFGGMSEEVWSAPSADGVMMGTYRHFKSDGNLNFYEFLLLDKTGIRVKHFTPEMHAWEKKEEYVHFEMVEYDSTRIVMNGLEIVQMSPTTMEIRLTMKSKDGSISTEVFRMRRVD